MKVDSDGFCSTFEIELDLLLKDAARKLADSARKDKARKAFIDQLVDWTDFDSCVGSYLSRLLANSRLNDIDGASSWDFFYLLGASLLRKVFFPRRNAISILTFH